MMILRKAKTTEFERIRDYYWHLIDCLEGKQYSAGWVKELYPTSEMLYSFIVNEEMYLMLEEDIEDITSISDILGTVALNTAYNPGYVGVPWRVKCKDEEVLVLHILTTPYERHGQGLGKKLVELIIAKAENEGKKALRLDILKGNLPAQRIYEDCEFDFVIEKDLYYEDTGRTTFPMYEYEIHTNI